MYLKNMTMSQFNNVKEELKGVIIPIGSTEAHGPHCPYGTDFLIPEELTNRLAKDRNDVLIAPTINYGASWNLGFFPGTINISSETLTRYIVEVGNGFLKWSIDNIVIMNGHGGNSPAIRIASQHLADAGAKVLVIDWWIDYQKDILKICSSKGHAGEDETSVVLAIDETLVDMELAPTNKNVPIGQVYTSDISYTVLENAITGDATKATKEKGQKVLDMVVLKIEGLLNKFFAGKYTEKI
jgi:creatinine amidohydrolase